MDRIIERKRGLQRKHIPYIAGGAFLLAMVLWLVFGSHRSTLRGSAEDVTVGTVTTGE